MRKLFKRKITRPSETLQLMDSVSLEVTSDKKDLKLQEAEIISKITHSQRFSTRKISPENGYLNPVIHGSKFNLHPLLILCYGNVNPSKV